ncbi:MAG: type IVB secretion system protein IcmV [Gammaproteobacteria bacterium]|nr:type IVB secretion system protein IcmV [Gammaproteobacteria bacterium]
MAIQDIFKVSRKTFFNPSGWLDTESLRIYNTTIWDSIRGLFITPVAEKKETFEEAMARLNLTEDDVVKIQRNYLIYAVLFVCLGAALFLFSLYLLFHHASFYGWLLALVSAGLCGAQAFRFHFWYFQIKFRKLGCTFEEWRRGKPDESQGPKP